ncbi:hypothetical protein GCM10022245_05350 [Streptomyces mayteni]
MAAPHLTVTEGRGTLSPQGIPRRASRPSRRGTVAGLLTPALGTLTYRDFPPTIEDIAAEDRSPR